VEPKASLASSICWVAVSRGPPSQGTSRRADFATLCFGEAAIGALHVVQQVVGSATAVQDGVPTHATPVDLIAAVEKHFAQCILDVAHESVGLVIDRMLANGFGDDGCCAGGDCWVGIWHCWQHEGVTVVERLVGGKGHGEEDMAMDAVDGIDRGSASCEFLESSKNPLAIRFSSDLVKTREYWVGICCIVAVGCRHGVDDSAGDFGAGPVVSEKDLVRQMAASVDEVSSSADVLKYE
jgi:hypothetical protein